MTDSQVADHKKPWYERVIRINGTRLSVMGSREGGKMIEGVNMGGTFLSL